VTVNVCTFFQFMIELFFTKSVGN